MKNNQSTLFIAYDKQKSLRKLSDSSPFGNKNNKNKNKNIKRDWSHLIILIRLAVYKFVEDGQLFFGYRH